MLTFCWPLYNSTNRLRGTIYYIRSTTIWAMKHWCSWCLSSSLLTCTKYATFRSRTIRSSTCRVAKKLGLRREHPSPRRLPHLVPILRVSPLQRSVAARYDELSLLYENLGLWISESMSNDRMVNRTWAPSHTLNYEDLRKPPCHSRIGCPAPITPCASRSSSRALTFSCSYGTTRVATSAICASTASSPSSKNARRTQKNSWS